MTLYAAAYYAIDYLLNQASFTSENIITHMALHSPYAPNATLHGEVVETLSKTVKKIDRKSILFQTTQGSAGIVHYFLNQRELLEQIARDKELYFMTFDTHEFLFQQAAYLVEKAGELGLSIDKKIISEVYDQKPMTADMVIAAYQEIMAQNPRQAQQFSTFPEESAYRVLGQLHNMGGYGGAHVYCIVNAAISETLPRPHPLANPKKALDHFGCAQANWDLLLLDPITKKEKIVTHRGFYFRY